MYSTKLRQYQFHLVGVLRQRYYQLLCNKNKATPISPIRRSISCSSVSASELLAWSSSDFSPSSSSSDLRSSSSSPFSLKKHTTKKNMMNGGSGVEGDMRFHKGSTISPQLFDTSLRDGIQMACVDDYSLTTKQNIMWHIMTLYAPAAIEVGSVVSPKMFPIFKDSWELMEFAQDAAKEATQIGYKPPPDLYLLTPNKKSLDRTIQHFANKKMPYPIHYSFITAMTDGFQGRNTKKTLVEHKLELSSMGRLLATASPQSKLKLYVSCVSECPIEQRKSDPHDVAIEIVNYLSMFPYLHINVCLSDTMGTLTFDEYKFIIDLIRYRYGSHDPYILSKLSLHLHVNESNLREVRHIIWYSLQKNMNQFDVSMLEGGGCKTTLAKTDVKPNLDYESFFNILYCKD